MKSKFDWLCRAKLHVFHSFRQQYSIPRILPSHLFTTLRDETRYRSESIGNREGRLFPRDGISKIGKPIERDNPSPRSVEVEREDEVERKKITTEDEGGGCSKNEFGSQDGRKCLIAVRGSSRRWRNWFRGTYTAGKR